MTNDRIESHHNLIADARNIRQLGTHSLGVIRQHSAMCLKHAATQRRLYVQEQAYRKYLDRKDQEPKTS